MERFGSQIKRFVNRLNDDILKQAIIEAQTNKVADRLIWEIIQKVLNGLISPAHATVAIDELNVAKLEYDEKIKEILAREETHGFGSVSERWRKSGGKLIRKKSTKRKNTKRNSTLKKQ